MVVTAFFGLQFGREFINLGLLHTLGCCVVLLYVLGYILKALIAGVHGGVIARSL